MIAVGRATMIAVGRVVERGARESPVTTLAGMAQGLNQLQLVSPPTLVPIVLVAQIYALQRENFLAKP